MTFSIEAIIAMLQAAIQFAPQAISTAEQLYEIGQKLFETLNGREPTQAEQDDLQRQIDADVAEALRPMPE